MGWNPVSKAKNEIKRRLGDAKKEISGAASSARKGIEKSANAAKYKVEYSANQARHQVEDIGNDMIHDIKEEGEKVIDQLEVDAEEVVTKVLDEILSAIAEGAINKAIDFAQVAAPDVIGITLGPIRIEIGGVKERIDTLQIWASNPPSGKDDLRKMIETLAPTSIQVNLGAQIAAVVVSSGSLKVAIDATWTTESFLDKFDDIMEIVNG